MFTAATKLLGEFYFRSSGAYHVTSPCGLHPHEEPPTNGHQRATWYCLQSTTTAVGQRSQKVRILRCLSKN